MIVCAVALGTVEVHPIALDRLLVRMDSGLLDRLHDVVARWFGNWAWARMALPLLQRPAWLFPVALAVVAVGLALSRSGRKTAQRSRRGS